MEKLNGNWDFDIVTTLITLELRQSGVTLMYLDSKHKAVAFQGAGRRILIPAVAFLAFTACERDTERIEIGLITLRLCFWVSETGEIHISKCARGCTTCEGLCWPLEGLAQSPTPTIEKQSWGFMQA